MRRPPRGALLLLLALCLLPAGCSPSDVFEPVLPVSSAPPEEEPPEPPDVLRLPVNLADGMNPYRLTSQANRNAAALLYDGLFALTPDYRAEPRAAASAEREGAVWRVSLRENARFSDGTPLTAQDVVYSFWLAAAEGSAYSVPLAQVVACGAQNGAVVFTLARGNSLFCNVLTFPIVKNGTGGAELPTGSGRFAVAETHGGGMRLLPGAGADRCGPVKEVELVAMPDDATIATALKTGAVHLAASLRLAQGELPAGVNSRTLDLNAFNFLAVNPSGHAADPAVRRAIYLAVNREELAQMSYGSKARAAFTPFNPAVDWLPDAEFVGRDGPARAAAALEAAGYAAGENGTREKGGEALRFALLVNGDNPVRVAVARRLADQLARVGIEIVPEPLPYADYLAEYAAGRYVLCLAEMQMCDDMAPEHALPGLGEAYGSLSQSYAAFLADTGEIDRFLADFMDENPLIPLVYRDGTFAFSRNFGAQPVATKGDIFYNMAEW